MTLAEAAKLLTRPDILSALAYHGRDCRTRDELAARLEREAVVHARASEGYAERGRYELAAGERERAALARRRAKALLALEALRIAPSPA